MSDETDIPLQNQPKNVPKPEGQNYFKQTATGQLNQLRIALIGISLGLCAFFAKEINGETIFCRSPYLYGIVLLSLLASVFGLAAWKFSARLFYEMGKGKTSPIEDARKNLCDTALSVLLALAVCAALVHLLFERTPT